MTNELERPFDEPWQARAFAITVNLHERGLLTWPAWAAALAKSIAADPTRTYYESWLDALQLVLIERQAVTEESITAAQGDWMAAAAQTPHGLPIELIRS